MKAIAGLLIAIITAAPVGAQAGSWVRDGLGLYWIETDATPLIDAARVREQKTAGCSGVTAVGFGYSAALRRAVPGLTFSPEHRRRFAGAALTDRQRTADALLREVLADPALSADARAVAENQRVFTAIMFSDQAAARALLEASTSDETAAAAIRADRVFLSGFLASRTAASPSDWKDVDAMMQHALALDPTHFGARAERVIAWLQAVQSTGVLPITGPDACPPALREFSEMTLDLSEAGPCPLLVGHIDHVLSRNLLDAKPQVEEVTSITGRSSSGPWRLFVAAILAEVIGNTAVRDAALTGLADPATDRSPGQCRSLIRTALESAIREVGRADGAQK